MIGSVLRNMVSERTAYWMLQDLYYWRSRMRHRSRGADKPEARYLNVGCGPHGMRGAEWLNIDCFPSAGVDRLWDAGRPLPVADGRFDGIYAEHFFEHLEPHEGKRFLAECLRALRPGGVLRLSVPDGELYLRNYFEDRDWMLARRKGRFRTPMEVVNEVFRQGRQHHYCFDFETLALWLREAGFTDVRRAAHREGADPALLLDRPEREFESLYVEGRRPA